MPFAFWAMLTGVLSICGIPLFQRILLEGRSDLRRARNTATRGSTRVGIVTAGLTAYYMFRLLFVTFFGAVPRRRRSGRPRHARRAARARAGRTPTRKATATPRLGS